MKIEVTQFVKEYSSYIKRNCVVYETTEQGLADVVKYFNFEKLPNGNYRRTVAYNEFERIRILEK